jgi:glutathione S-transferase
MIKLYGHPFSLNARKAQWALEELELQYEYQTINIPKGEQKTSEFLAINPAGRIPALTDGDVTVCESNAIVTYLADQYGGGKLLPTDKKARAQTLQWLFWQTSDGSTALSRPWFLQFVMPMISGQPVDMAAHAVAVANAAPPLKFLDDALAHRAYVAGDVFTAADICVGEAVALTQIGGVDLALHANVRRWLDLISARPAYVKTRPQMQSAPFLKDGATGA